MPVDHRAASIGFVGAGKVAQTLAAAFGRAGWTVAAASSRNPANVAAFVDRCPDAVGTTRAQEVVDSCAVVFLTVVDDEIARVCESLRWRGRVAAVHCSGATGLEALSSARAQGARVGAFHPMQMFANPEVALATLPGCTVGLEAESPLCDTLEALARDIGCTPLVLPPGARAAYHASAYYVGPFLIALLREGAKLWERFGVAEPQALGALVPLLNGTVAAALDGGLARGMGGCVARGDVGTLRTHLAAIEVTDREAGALYRALSLRTIPLGLQRGSLPPAQARTMETVLTGTAGEPPPRAD